MNIYRPFFGTHFKAATLLITLAVFLVWPIIGTQAQHEELEERELLADLIDGGADLFDAVKHGVIQVMNEGGAGSGYIIDKEGHAITNRHVTDGNPYFEIAFWGEEEKSRLLGYRHRGVLIAEDPALDLAVIKVEAPYEKFQPVKLGISGDLEVGDVVATCGSPGGSAQRGNYLNPSNPSEGWLEYFNINLGVLTEIVPFEQAFGFLYYDYYWDPTRREHYGTALEYILHVDAAINGGNSGGPCFNAYGEAVGTNTWGRGAGAYENWGLSVPTDLLKKSVADIIGYGRVRRPWVGIALHEEIPEHEIEQMINKGMVTSLWFNPRPKQLELKVVNPYSPAYEAGLREGDIIERIDGERMTYIFDIYKYFLNSDLGQTIEFKIRRGTSPMSIDVEVGEKKVRFFGADVNAGTIYNSVSVQTYHSPITY
jgi:serine protease Do